MGAIRRVRVLGAPVDCVDMAGALAHLRGLAENGSAGNAVFAVNPEKVMALRRDPRLAKTFADAALLVPDGIGVAAAMRLLHGESPRRVPGVELMDRLCGMAAEQGWSIFVYGSREAVNKAAAAKLQARHPGLAIAGRCHGYIGEDGTPALVEAINRSGADILFVALGSPRQERWVARHLPGLRVRVCQAIGGTLDTITGEVRRAPAVFRRTGLEWLYRLASEPARIRRQAVLPVFALDVIRARLGRRNPHAEAG